jgi:signal recognition particle receptor subunit beta
LAAVKILIAGAEGSGKRELVESISDMITDPGAPAGGRFDRAKRARRHHALEFGQIEVDPSLVVQLYVLPADREADFMWQILGQDAVGFVVLAATEGVADLDDTRHMLTVLSRMAIPFVVGVNGAQPGDEAVLRQAREGLQVPPDVPVEACDCMDRESVKALLCKLFECITASVRKRPGQPVSSPK